MHRLALIPLLLLGCRTSPASQTLRASMAGKQAVVDLYWPDGDESAPLVVVAHGFARSRHRMSGWGTTLSEAGFAVAVPNLPYFAAHHDNADGVVELVQTLIADHPDRIDPDRVGLVGFSAGGLATAVAAHRLGTVDVWVGLDPVDSGSSATAAAAELDLPALTLFAEPDGCNANGNGLAIRDAWVGPLASARVIGATHCDPEQPSNTSCALFCGRPDPERGEAFLTWTTAALRAALHCDPDALARFEVTDSDDRLADVQLRGFSEGIRARCADAAPPR